MAYSEGDRVTTASGNMVGTVIEQDGDVVLLEWDDEAGPQEDEVPTGYLRRAHGVAAARS